MSGGGPPPGYNPGQSVLQGGTATIHPVMGGGGLGGSYENQSLLSGGEGAQIHAVQGGGAEADAENGYGYGEEYGEEDNEGGNEGGNEGDNESEGNTQEGGARIPKKPVVSENVSLDYVTDIDAQNEIMTNALAKFNELLHAYIVRQQSTFWRRHNRINAADASTPRILKNSGCPNAGTLGPTSERGEGGYDRLAIVLPKSTTTVYVFPPVKGGVNQFKECMTIFEATKGISGNVYLFAAPFFGMNVNAPEASIEQNKQIFATFLALKKEFPHMYILTEVTAKNKLIGSCLGGKNEEPVASLLEPTYVIYPHIHIIEEPNAVNPTEMIRRNIGGIIFSAAAANEVLLSASNIPSRLSSPAEYVRKGGNGAVAFPPNPIVEDMKINAMYDFSLQYRYIGEADAKGLTVISPGEVQRVTIQTPTESRVSAAILGMSQDLFLGSDDEELRLSGVKYSRVPLGPQIYSFRVPGDGNGVMEDWENQLFTKDEAAFLNDLNMRKSIVEAAFKGVNDGVPSTPKRLARFLQNMVFGKCFSDERMLTRAECQESRDFVQRILQYFITHDERIARLSKEEDAAERRLMKLRTLSAEDRVNAAEQMAKDAAAGAKQAEDGLKGAAAAAGVDLARGDDYKKDPFADQRVKAVGASSDVDVIDPEGDIGPGGKASYYYLEIRVVDKVEGTYRKATVRYQVTGGKTAEKVGGDILNDLRKEYPRYAFLTTA